MKQTYFVQIYQPFEFKTKKYFVFDYKEFLKNKKEFHIVRENKEIVYIYFKVIINQKWNIMLRSDSIKKSKDK